MDVFDLIRAKHEGRVMRWRNMPCPLPRSTPPRPWWDRRGKRQDAAVRRYDAEMIAGWWEVEHEILFKVLTPVAS